MATQHHEGTRVCAQYPLIGGYPAYMPENCSNFFL